MQTPVFVFSEPELFKTLNNSGPFKQPWLLCVKHAVTLRKTPTYLLCWYLCVYLLVYADDVNILGGSVHTIKKKSESLLVASKEIGLEVNSDKTKYMVMSRDHNAGWSHNIKIDNGSFEMV